MEAASVQTVGAPTDRRRSKGIPERRLAKLMVAPSVILIAIVAAYPIIYAVWLSLHEYSVRQAGLSRWAGSLGLRNYSAALHNSEWWAALEHTLVFTVASVALELVIGLGMALAMHAAFRGQSLLRTTVLVPWAVLTVVTAVMWRTMFVSPYGFVNTILGTQTVWLGSEPQALIVIILADVWKTAPFMALLILAGLQVIPGEVYEAAEVDGASTWQRFTRITLPLLTPAILVALIFRTLDALRIFDLPYVLTGGQNGTSTLSTIAQEAFAANRLYGLGAAMAVLTFIVVMIVSFSYIRFVGGDTVWLGSSPQALIVIIIADVWKTAPFMALLILAGLQVIPGDIYEAAKVDGATAWQRFRKITLPLLTPAILVALIFRTLDALRIFDLPYVLTKGANGTTTLSLIAQQTFAENRIYGLGAAYSILTFITVMIVSFIYIRFVGGNLRGMAEE